jgi:hypothetical protein
MIGCCLARSGERLFCFNEVIAPGSNEQEAEAGESLPIPVYEFTTQEVGV